MKPGQNTRYERVKEFIGQAIKELGQDDLKKAVQCMSDITMKAALARDRQAEYFASKGCPQALAASKRAESELDQAIEDLVKIGQKDAQESLF